MLKLGWDEDSKRLRMQEYGERVMAVEDSYGVD
jgi:hypothetical protein